MKKYIKPAIKVKQMEIESLMASMSRNDGVGNKDQLGKENYFEDEESQWSKPSNVWDDTEDE